MQITETLNEGLKREFQVVVPADDIENRLVGKLGELARNVRLPGFRPGKAPVKLLRKTYGKQVLGEVLQETINEATGKAIQDNALKPAMQPKVEITSFDEGKDLEYKVAVELMPEFDTVDFKELTLERLTVAITDEMVDERIGRLADGMKAYQPAAEGQEAQLGDRLSVDFKGTVDGEAFEGGSAEDFDLVLGDGGRVPGFDDGLVGAKAGETRNVPVTFPADYGAPNLAGKQASFEIAVKKIEVPLPTAVDDSLAGKLGLATLDELKTTVRGMIEREFAGMSRAKLKRALLDALAERHSFAVPPGMIDLEFESIWQQVQQDLERQGKTAADLDKPEEESKAEYRAIAERRVRLGLLLADVGQKNNISVAQNELNAAIAEQARRFPGQERKVLEYFQKTPEAQAQLRAPILEDKVCDFIVGMAQVSERAVTPEDLMKDDEEETAGAPAA